MSMPLRGLPDPAGVIEQGGCWWGAWACPLQAASPIDGLEPSRVHGPPLPSLHHREQGLFNWSRPAVVCLLARQGSR